MTNNNVVKGDNPTRNNALYALPINDDMTALEAELRSLKLEILHIYPGVIAFVSKELPILKHGTVEEPEILELS